MLHSPGTTHGRPGQEARPRPGTATPRWDALCRHRSRPRSPNGRTSGRLGLGLKHKEMI